MNEVATKLDANPRTKPFAKKGDYSVVMDVVTMGGMMLLFVTSTIILTFNFY